MSSKWKNGEAVAAGLLLLTLSAAPAASQVPDPPKRGAVGRKAVETPVPDFVLMDQDKRPFHLSGLRGKMVLVSFIYTTCPDVCPLLTAKFAGIQRKLKSQGRNGYFLLSITTDPGADTAKVLRSYGGRFGADFHSWAFLTGDKNELSEAWRFFGVRVRQRGQGLTGHTGLTTLIDREGVRRIDYYGDSWTEREVLKDIAELGTAPKPVPIAAEAARVKILAPREGQTVEGDEIPLHFKLSEGKKGEHVHVYVNGELMGMFQTEKGTLTGIRPGRHVLEVRIVAEDHQTEFGATDKVHFVVK
jgi:protein SCO1/2